MAEDAKAKAIIKKALAAKVPKGYKPKDKDDVRPQDKPKGQGKAKGK